MSERAVALDLRVRLLDDPCLWCWEIVDPDRGDALVHSSWGGEWTAYESPTEARSAGRARLAELRCAGAGRGGGRDPGNEGESAA